MSSYSIQRSSKRWGSFGQPGNRPAMVQSLESRRLLAAAIGDVIDMEWQGRTIQACAGEWLVGLKSPEPTRDASGEIIDYNTKCNWSEQPNAAVSAALARNAAGITFGRYLGVEHSFLVTAPPSASYEQIVATFKSLAGFAYVEPNGIWHAASDSLIGNRGNDTINSGSGNDRLFSDHYSTRDNIIDYVYGGAGSDDRATVGSSPYEDVVDSLVEVVMRV